MNLKFYSPKSDVLKKYIKGYYFIIEDNEYDQVIYKTFPNNYNIVTVMQNISLHQSDNQIIITASKEKNIFSNIVYRYKNPIEIFYQKQCNEITIYFKPLGLNFFIDKLEPFYSKDHTRAIEFDPFTDYKAVMEKIFSIQNREEQIEEFENYWLSKFIEKNFSMMKILIQEVETDININEIAKKTRYQGSI